jgi:hypothetical protein
VYSPNYNVRIGGSQQSIPAMWESTNELSFIAPPSPTGASATVDVFIFINDTQYAEEPVSLDYVGACYGLRFLSIIIARSATHRMLSVYLILVVSSSVSAPVLGSTISIALAVIIALVVALIIMKTRKIGFFNEFKLKEPDYVIVAFGSAMLEEQYRAPKDGWDILIQKITKEPNFVDMLVLGTAATEEDQLARTLVYVFERFDVSVPSIVRLVQREINSTEFENTLFRSNSVASKMFKFYSKVVGIKYLFNCLARYIMEINKLAENVRCAHSFCQLLLSSDV